MKLTIHRLANTLAGATLIALLATNPAAAGNRPLASAAEDDIALHYSDGSQPDHGLAAVNARLLEVGVRVSRVAIPEDAKPVIRHAETRALSQQEADELIGYFHLGRHELLDEIHKAGRAPALHLGGYLATSERNVPPYPKVYDMQSLDGETTAFLQRKFGRLHVNSSDTGVGIDEVMTIVAGGPYTWFFVFDDNVVGKLRFGKIDLDGKAWRISYPGLVPHGGYFDAPHGLVVAYAHGPQHFVMRYQDKSVRGHETLGDNPWIDFAGAQPRLLNGAHPLAKTPGIVQSPYTAAVAAQPSTASSAETIDGGAAHGR